MKAPETLAFRRKSLILQTDVLGKQKAMWDFMTDILGMDANSAGNWMEGLWLAFMVVTAASLIGLCFWLGANA